MNPLKASLRKRLKKKLANIKATSSLAKSRKITAALLALPAYQQARKILCYAALPREVQTGAFIRKALRAGKKVYVPRITPQGRQMRVCRILNLQKDLRPGVFGIPEPVARRRSASQRMQMDLIVVPGLGFDFSGGRLGRGKGYFDRFLAGQPKAYKVGVAFSEQRVKKIPLSKQDVKMDAVITDTRSTFSPEVL